jgi:hypothetical protein
VSLDLLISLTSLFAPFTSTGVNQAVPIFDQNQKLIGHANKGLLRLQDEQALMVEAISEDGHMTILSIKSNSQLRPCNVELTAGTGRGG